MKVLQNLVSTDVKQNYSVRKTVEPTKSSPIPYKQQGQQELMPKPNIRICPNNKPKG
jgi:hypothetical protein